jgi:EmrB/QacA subfamily drug resistance transporter
VSRGSRAVLALTGMALFMTILDNLVVVSALPTIERSLHASLDATQWILDAYILSFGVLILTGAALGDRFGRRRVFVIGLIVFSAASAACATSGSLTALVLGRIVQGAGGAVLMPLTLTILTVAVPPEQRPLMLGIWSSVSGLAVAVGPLLGGLVTSALSWHWIFWINVPVGVTVAVLTPRWIDESHGARERIDITGLALATAGLFGIIWATVRGNDAGWLAFSTVAAYAGGVALLVCFVLFEAKRPEPMMPLRFFRNFDFSAANAAGFLLHFAMFGAFVMSIQFLAGVKGESPVMSGVWTLPWTVMPLALSASAGRLGQRVNPAIIAAAGLALLGIGMVGLGVTLDASTQPLSVCPAFFLIGGGIGLSLPNIVALALRGTAAANLGKASGILSTARQLGAVFGAAVSVAILQASPGTGPAGVTSGIGHAFLATGLAAGLGVAVMVASTRRSRSDVEAALPSVDVAVAPGSDARSAR